MMQTIKELNKFQTERLDFNLSTIYLQHSRIDIHLEKAR